MGRLGSHPHIVTVYDIGEENGLRCCPYNRITERQNLGEPFWGPTTDGIETNSQMVGRVLNQTQLYKTLRRLMQWLVLSLTLGTRAV